MFFSFLSQDRHLPTDNVDEYKWILSCIYLSIKYLLNLKCRFNFITLWLSSYKVERDWYLSWRIPLLLVHTYYVNCIWTCYFHLIAYLILIQSSLLLLIGWTNCHIIQGIVLLIVFIEWSGFIAILSEPCIGKWNNTDVRWYYLNFPFEKNKYQIYLHLS